MKNGHADYYAILGVQPTATPREIARAYRGLLRRLHPDTRKKIDDGGTSEAVDLQQLQAIMQAYVVLSDPGKRAAYDRERTSDGPAGTPVKVRVHRQPAPRGPAEPLSFGPTRWWPGPGNTFPRRPT